VHSVFVILDVECILFCESELQKSHLQYYEWAVQYRCLYSCDVTSYWSLCVTGISSSCAVSQATLWRSYAINIHLSLCSPIQNFKFNIVFSFQNRIWFIIVKILNLFFLPRLSRYVPIASILAQVTFQWLLSLLPIGIRGSKHGVLSLSPFTCPCRAASNRDKSVISVSVWCIRGVKLHVFEPYPITCK
jgi:hypothetical protein